MDIQRLRNLTTGRLHTKMSDIYEDLEEISGMKGIMTHDLPRVLKAITPWLKKNVTDKRLWEDKYDTTHIGGYNLPMPTDEERKSFFSEFAKLPSLLEKLGENIKQEEIMEKVFKPETTAELIEYVKMRVKKDYECDLSHVDTSGITSMRKVFYESEFNGNIRDWDVSNVTDMSLMFSRAKNFNGKIDRWNTSNVFTMLGMFWGAKSFNRYIGGWNVSSVTDMSYMFGCTENFNRYIQDWNVEHVDNFNSMFAGAEKFTRSLSFLDIGPYCDTRKMFDGCPIDEEDKPIRCNKNLVMKNKQVRDSMDFWGRFVKSYNK